MDDTFTPLFEPVCFDRNYQQCANQHDNLAGSWSPECGSLADTQHRWCLDQQRGHLTKTMRLLDLFQKSSVQPDLQPEIDAQIWKAIEESGTRRWRVGNPVPP